MLAAFNTGHWLDKLFSALAIAGVSLPHYWFAIIMVVIFSVTLNVLPAQGMGEGSFFEQIPFLILPVDHPLAHPDGRRRPAGARDGARHPQPGIRRRARSQGSRPRRILFHIVKNAAPPVLALMGLQFGYLLGGSILVETVFNWPGSGNLLNLAIFRRDIPVLQGTILVLALLLRSAQSRRRHRPGDDRPPHPPLTEPAIP